MKKNQKSALIIGCSGTFSTAMAKELILQGWLVKGLIRDLKSKPEHLNENQIIEGNCLQSSDLIKALSSFPFGKKPDLVIYGANPAYHQWQKLCEKMLEPILTLAESMGLHLLFPGNVYAYNPQKTPLIDEKTPMEAMHIKGKIRMAMEQQLKKACKKGAQVTLIRMGDFVAPNSDSSWMNHFLKPTKKHWLLLEPLSSGHIHNYAWMPDVAKNALALCELDCKKGGFNDYHEAGFSLSDHDIERVLGSFNYPLKVKPFPWWRLQLLGLFIPLIKSVVNMRYLWQQNLQLDGTKMQASLGHKLSKTPVEQVLRQFCTLRKDALKINSKIQA